MASNAVLCITCGYHLELQQRLKVEFESRVTAPESEPAAIELDPNPYAPPRPVPSNATTSQLELTESEVNLARIIVSDAEYMPWILIASLCCCAIPMPLMLPYYAYRLANWRKLDAMYPELHSPNSFSPHGLLAAEFQDAKFRLVLGVAFGAFFYVVALISGVITLINPD